MDSITLEAEDVMLTERECSTEEIYLLLWVGKTIEILLNEKCRLK